MKIIIDLENKEFSFSFTFKEIVFYIGMIAFLTLLASILWK